MPEAEERQSIGEEEEEDEEEEEEEEKEEEEGGRARVSGISLSRHLTTPDGDDLSLPLLGFSLPFIPFLLHYISSSLLFHHLFSPILFPLF